MNLRRLYYLARADFLERVRRHGFLVALVFSVYAAYLFLPPNPSSYATLKLGEYRGVYNSAWIGTAVAMLCTVFISMVGFFVVKNAVERDRRTRVGEILATTPVTRVQYVLAKTFSNFAVLAAMTLVVAVSCIGMQLIRAEDRTIDIVALFAPFLLLTMPFLLITGAFAVFFEVMPVLRGGVGNIAWIILWSFMLASNFEGNPRTPHNDPLGVGIALPSMYDAAEASYAEFEPDSARVSMGFNIRTEGKWVLKTYPWEGISWSAQHLGWRFSWVLLGLAVGTVAAIPFDRFDPSRRGAAATNGRRQRRRRKDTQVAQASDVIATTPKWDASLTPLSATARGFRFFALVQAEWKLITRGSKWWYIPIIGGSVAAFLAPVDAVRSIVLPGLWFWPILKWSTLGTRESRYGTEGILFSSPHPLGRQLTATWLAGVLLAVLAASAVAVRFVIAGEFASLAAWCVGAAFIPSAALALGVWTGSGKAFEALYAFACYAVLQRVPPMDFMGAVPEATRSGRPAFYALLGAAFLLAAFLGRRRKLRS